MSQKEKREREMREGREEKGEEICNNFRTLTWNANLCVQREGEKEWR